MFFVLICCFVFHLIVIKTQQLLGKETEGTKELSPSRGSGWFSVPAVLPLPSFSRIIETWNGLGGK